MKTNSIAIQHEMDRVGGQFKGTLDGYVLWQLGDGRQVIDTGGDPIWEGDPRFAELVATCWTAEDILRQSG